MSQTHPEGDAATGVASLPMYDWPEIRAATDTLWTAIHQQLQSIGIAAPYLLDRSDDPEPLWRHPDLILSQTCGFPYANGLAGKVTLIGAPAHAITGAAPGRYFSVLVARKADTAPTLADLVDRRFAYNMTHSQSGFAAPVRLLAAGGHASRPQPLQTGAHRASIHAVARREADWAAIDAVTWELAKRHDAAADELQMFGKTPGTPALPLIASIRYTDQAEAIASAIKAAFSSLPAGIRDATLVTGLARVKQSDYAPLAEPVPVSEALPALSI